MSIKSQEKKEKSQQESLPENESEKLPQFPEKEIKERGGPSGDDEIPEIDLEEICRDVISIPFEIWHILRPGVPPLSEGEKKLVGKPLARVAQKYDVARYMKDEFLLIGLLGSYTLKRARTVKKEAAKTPPIKDEDLPR